MRKPVILVGPLLIALALGAALARVREHPAMPEPRRPLAPDVAAPAGLQPPPQAPAPVAGSLPAPGPEAPPAARWQQEPDRARRRWAKALLEHPPTLTRDEILVELARIEQLPDGDERISAVRGLFGSGQIDRTAAEQLLALYDRSAPGDFRKALFGALLFSTAGDFVAEQMLFRSRMQDPDLRDYAQVGILASRHAEAWELLSSSVPACRGEEAACRAALAVAGMAADYPGLSDGEPQARRLQSLLAQTTWPSARVYLFQALLVTRGEEGREGARAALLQERDEEVRRRVLEIRPGLDQK